MIENIIMITVHDGDMHTAQKQALQETAAEVYAAFMTGNFVVRTTSRQFNQIPNDQGTEWITWGEKSLISNGIKDLLGPDDNEDESRSTRKDALQPGV